MELLEILGLICALVGVAGCVVPILPGTPICFVGMLLCQWAGAGFSTDTLIVWAVVAVAVTLLDNFLPVLMTKRFGGSKAASRGAMVGIIVGFFAGPLGLILGPFFGALIGELTHDGSDSARAFKVAFGSFAAFICGTGIKLAASIYMTIEIWKAIF
ncbi:MAG: DUF456 domain-containing protein [Rikenellaceae bacterium]|nr:DUF456 domain-containing protein [Rikenellaceae bacterium]